MRRSLRRVEKSRSLCYHRALARPCQKRESRRVFATYCRNWPETREPREAASRGSVLVVRVRVAVTVVKARQVGLEGTKLNKNHRKTAVLPPLVSGLVSRPGRGSRRRRGGDRPRQLRPRAPPRAPAPPARPP